MALANWYSASNTTRPNRLVGNPDKTRVLLMGDSIAVGIYGSGGGDGLLKDLLESRDFQTKSRAFGGTGLLDFNSATSGPFAGPRNKWCKIASDEMTAYDPDIVIFAYRGNYQGGTDPGQPDIPDGYCPEFYAAWQEEALHITNICRGTAAAGNTRQILWQLGPAQGLPNPETQTRTVSGNTANIIQTYKRTGYFNLYELLPDPWSETNCEGTAVFSPDGVHLTTAGSKIAAEAIVDRIVP